MESDPAVPGQSFLCHSVLEGLVESFLFLFTNNHEAFDAKGISLVSLLGSRLRILADIESFYSCGEADEYISSEVAQPSGALLVLHCLNAIGASETVAGRSRGSDIILRDAVFSTLLVILRSSGVRNVQMCFPGISSFVAKTMMSTGKRGEVAMIGACSAGDFCAAGGAYLYYGHDVSAEEWSVAAQGVEGSTCSPIRPCAALDLSLVSHLLPTAPSGTLSGYTSLAMVYITGLIACLGDQAVKGTGLDESPWLRAAWVRVAAHLPFVLPLPLMEVLLQSVDDAWLLALLTLATRLLNDGALYAVSLSPQQGDESCKAALRHVQCLYLLAWEVSVRRRADVGQKGNDDAVPRRVSLCDAARDELLHYTIVELFPTLITSPFFARFTSSETSEGGGRFPIVLLLPAVRFVRIFEGSSLPKSVIAGSMPISDESLFYRVSSLSFVEVLVDRLCRFMGKAEEMHAEITFGLRGGGSEPLQTPPQLISDVKEASAASSPDAEGSEFATQRTAQSVLDTRAVRRVCEAIYLWLVPLSPSHLEGGVRIIAPGDGGHGEGQAGVGAAVFSEVLIPLLTESVLQVWEQYALHKGAVLLLAGLFDAANCGAMKAMRAKMIAMRSAAGAGGGGDEAIPKKPAVRRFGGGSILRQRRGEGSGDGGANPSLTALAVLSSMSAAVNKGLVESALLWGTLSSPHLWQCGEDWELCSGKQRGVRAANAEVIMGVMSHVSRQVVREALAATSYYQRAVAPANLASSLSLLTSAQRAARRLSVLWLFQLLEKASLHLPLGAGESGAGGASAGGYELSTAALTGRMRTAAQRAMADGIGLLGHVIMLPTSSSSSVPAVGSAAGRHGGGEGDAAAEGSSSQQQPAVLLSSSSLALLHSNCRSVVGGTSRGNSGGNSGVTAAVVLEQSDLIMDECCRLLAAPSAPARQLGYRFIAATTQSTATSVLTALNSAFASSSSSAAPAAWGLASSSSSTFDSLSRMLTNLLRITREEIDGSTSCFGMGGGGGGGGSSLSASYEKDRILCLEQLSQSSAKVATAGVRVVIDQCFRHLNASAHLLASTNTDEDEGRGGGGCCSSLGRSGLLGEGRFLDYVVETSLRGGGAAAAAAAAAGAPSKGGDDDNEEDNAIEALLKKIAGEGDADADDGAGATAASLLRSQKSTSDTVGEDNGAVNGGAAAAAFSTRIVECLRCLALLQQELGESGDSNRDELKFSAVALREVLKLLRAVIPMGGAMSGRVGDGGAAPAAPLRTHSLLRVVSALERTVSLLVDLQSELLATIKLLCLNVGMIVGRGGGGPSTTTTTSLLLSSSSTMAAVHTEWSALFPMMCILRHALEGMGTPSPDGLNNTNALRYGAAGDGAASNGDAGDGDDDGDDDGARARRVMMGSSTSSVFDCLSPAKCSWLPMTSQHWSTLHMVYGAVLPLLATTTSFGLGIEHLLREGKALSDAIAARAERTRKTTQQVVALRARRTKEEAEEEEERKSDASDPKAAPKMKKVLVEAVGEERDAEAEGAAAAAASPAAADAAAPLPLIDQVMCDIEAAKLQRTREGRDVLLPSGRVSSSLSPFSSLSPQQQHQQLSSYPWPQWIRTMGVDAHHAAVIDFLCIVYQSAPGFTEARMCEEVAPLLLRVWYRRLVQVPRVRGSKERAVVAAIDRFVGLLRSTSATASQQQPPASPSSSSSFPLASGPSGGGMFERLVLPIMAEVGYVPRAL